MAKQSSATLDDIARAAGVSKMTVSRVLRGAKGFSDATRDKVLHEADRLSYVPNRIAASFSSDVATTLVGVCVPRLTSGLFGEVLDGADREFSRMGYQTMIGSHFHEPESEESWLREIVSWRPAGVILSSRAHTAGTIQLLRSSAVPVVEIWELNTSPIDMSIGFSHFDCGREMGYFLARQGRHKIGYLGALSKSDEYGKSRLAGFEEALNQSGLQIAERELLLDSPSFYAGYYGLETLLARRRDLDAVYFHNDEMAIGGIAYCQTKGINIPGDLAIAGWGAMEASAILPLRLTTTSVPTQALGKQAAQSLVARLRGEPCDDVIAIPTRLIPGETV